jgi:hypothetical protein
MERVDVREGMIVRSADGEKLGKVVEAGEDDFLVEKGLFFHKETRIRYDDVSERAGELILVSTRAELIEPEAGKPASAAAGLKEKAAELKDKAAGLKDQAADIKEKATETVEEEVESFRSRGGEARHEEQLAASPGEKPEEEKDKEAEEPEKRET